MAISDEFKIILEDINQKFDILIEGHNGLNQKFDQLDHKIDREIEDRQAADAVLLKETRELRTDLNEHRNNTELHGERKQRKTS
jgi:ribonucleotide monophosphatase NagD (HAD superfamily)